MNNRDKWIVENGFESDNEKYYKLGVEAFSNGDKKTFYHIIGQLYKTDEFQYDRSSTSTLRVENWYQQWSKGYEDAYAKYYRLDEFNKKLDKLMEEFNMDVDPDGNYFPKEEKS